MGFGDMAVRVVSVWDWNQWAVAIVALVLGFLILSAIKGLRESVDASRVELQAIRERLIKMHTDSIKVPKETETSARSTQAPEAGVTEGRGSATDVEREIERSYGPKALADYRAKKALAEGTVREGYEDLGPLTDMEFNQVRAWGREEFLTYRAKTAGQ